MATTFTPVSARRLQRRRLEQLATVKPFVAASLVQINVRCGRAGCHCVAGTGHPSAYLTLKRSGKTITVYVPKSRWVEVRQWVGEYHRVKALLREISDLSLRVLRAEARARRTQARRRSQ